MTNVMIQSLPFALGIMVLGILLITWGFSCTPVRQARTFRDKLNVLLSDGLEGPDSCMRLCFTGLVANAIGGTLVLSHIAPSLMIGFFLVCWVALFALGIVANARKSDRRT